MKTSIQKSPWLVQALIVSMALNIALLLLCFYFLIQKNPVHFSYKPTSSVIEPSSYLSLTTGTLLLEKLQKAEYSDLVALLSDQQIVEKGYRMRDFALGSLVCYHDFDVERALAKSPLSTQKWKCEETPSSANDFLLFPSLSHDDFKDIILFISQERWPFTPKGLFKKIASTTIEKSDTDLIQFFCHTPPFLLLETLLARTHVPIQKRDVLTLALEGGWQLLSKLCHMMEENGDFSSHVRQTYLLDALARNSPMAAYLLIVTDRLFVIEQLDDRQIATILDLLPNNQAAFDFVEQIVFSVRSDALRDLAMNHMSHYTGNKSDIAGSYCEKELRPLFRQRPPAAPTPRTHLILPGESLWLIAKKYHVTIDSIMEYNHLQSAVIQPGKSLKIPFSDI